MLDRLAALLLDPLAKLASGSSRGAAGAAGSSSASAAVLFRGFTPAQQAVAEEVRQRLAALAAMGRGASGCLGRALAAMSARKLLRAPQVAAGLEAFLLAAGERSAATNCGSMTDNVCESIALEEDRKEAGRVLTDGGVLFAVCSRRRGRRRRCGAARPSWPRCQGRRRSWRRGLGRGT